MYFLGVDTGGTKTAFLLIDETGAVRAEHRSSGGGFLGAGREGITRLVSDGIAVICEQAGITKDDITFAGLGFPGYGEKEGSEEAVQSACADALAPNKIFCECDCYLGWAGSLAMEPGINVIAGTGANCYGVNENGNSARASGWGAYCDEGSCTWVGARLIQYFTKQSDGRMPRTLLYDVCREHFKITGDDNHFIAVLNGQIARKGTETAKLQLVVERLANVGDPCAAAIYKEAAAELALCIHAVAQKLGWKDKPYNASYSGGLFKAGDCILVPLKEAVAAYGGTLVTPRYTPDQGACLMALRAYNPQFDFTNFTFKY